MDPTTTRTNNLRALAWIVAITGDPDTETAYAIDNSYVYRRETDLCESVPRPRYFRASHTDVLLDDRSWDDGRKWESCKEDGSPLHPNWQVFITFDQLLTISAPDAESAKVKAVSRLGLSETLLRRVHAAIQSGDLDRQQK